MSDLKFQISSSRNGFKYIWQSPAAKETHLITSSTKMFAATIVQKLVEERKLRLSDSIGKHLPLTDYANLNVQHGVDQSSLITVRDLLSHTSGVADYYQLKRLPKVGDVANLSAQDSGWSFEEAIALARQLPAKFSPNSGKAHYSFTNYQLVGRIIENVTNQSLSHAYSTRIFEPLELTQTSLLSRGDLDPFYSASQVLIGKQAYLGARRIASLGAEGGIVSSTNDTTKFLQSFFDGKIVSPEGRDALIVGWLPIFPGIHYAAGVMSLRLPRLLTRARHSGRFLGHSGATGHIMFFDPKERLSIVGTINQVKPSVIPYQLMTSILRVMNSD